MALRHKPLVAPPAWGLSGRPTRADELLSLPFAYRPATWLQQVLPPSHFPSGDDQFGLPAEGASAEPFPILQGWPLRPPRALVLLNFLGNLSFPIERQAALSTLVARYLARGVFCFWGFPANPWNSLEQWVMTLCAKSSVAAPRVDTTFDNDFPANLPFAASEFRGGQVAVVTGIGWPLYLDPVFLDSTNGLGNRDEPFARVTHPADTLGQFAADAAVLRAQRPHYLDFLGLVVVDFASDEQSDGTTIGPDTSFGSDYAAVAQMVQDTTTTQAASLADVGVQPLRYDLDRIIALLDDFFG